MTLTIFPDPAKITELDGTFTVPATIAKALGIFAENVQENIDALASFSIAVAIAGENDPIDGIGAEGYTLNVALDGITIKGNTETGCFYGIQTLRWLLPKDGMPATDDEDAKIEMPCCYIVDYPRFSYRGYLFDEGRYFLGKDMVKSVLDWMALLKLNQFHWHLTEDQGWRIEIKKYPKLTEIGSKRTSTPTYRNGEPVNGEENSDGIPHEGFYTQGDIAEIVDYAAKRHITIVPEIEMPGHATAALASYPEMRCILPDDFPPEGADVFGRHLDGVDIKVATKWGVYCNIFCASNTSTMEFIHDILEEVVHLFPGPIIHVGGDEVPKTQWMLCERCQEKMAELGLANEEDLQKAFTAEIIDFLAGLGKKTMVWNEHTDETLAGRKEHAICQYWTGSIKNVNGFLERGGKLVMSTSSALYVDYAYHTLPMKKVYEYDPLGTEAQVLSELALENANSGGVMGIETSMWGEVFQNKWQVEYLTFPRIFAAADIAWTPQDAKDYARFMERVVIAVNFLDLLGISHATLEEADPTKEAIRLAKKNPKFGFHAYF